MTKLVLIGVPQDAERLAALTERLCPIGYACEVQLVPSAGDVAAPEGQTEALAAICWTTNSVGPAGAGLQAYAASLAKEGRYLGLLLDGVTVPLVVATAQDVSLVGWEANPEASAFANLAVALEKRGDAQRSLLAGIFSRLGELIDRLRHYHATLKDIGILAVVGSLIAAAVYLGLFPQNVQVCRWPAASGMCRALHIGNPPAKDDAPTWAAIQSGSDCGAIEGYLRKFGPTALHAADASLRLSVPVLGEAKGEKAMRMPVSVTTMDRPSASMDAARAAFEAVATDKARKTCGDYAQSYSGIAKPGTFDADGEVRCSETYGGYACIQSGYAQCVFIDAQPTKTCPPK